MVLTSRLVPTHHPAPDEHTPKREVSPQQQARLLKALSSCAYKSRGCGSGCADVAGALTTHVNGLLAGVAAAAAAAAGAGAAGPAAVACVVERDAAAAAIKAALAPSQVSWRGAAEHAPVYVPASMQGLADASAHVHCRMHAGASGGGGHCRGAGCACSAGCRSRHAGGSHGDGGRRSCQRRWAEAGRGLHCWPSAARFNAVVLPCLPCCRHHVYGNSCSCATRARCSSSRPARPRWWRSRRRPD